MENLASLVHAAVAMMHVTFMILPCCVMVEVIVFVFEVAAVVPWMSNLVVLDV